MTSASLREILKKSRRVRTKTSKRQENETQTSQNLRRNKDKNGGSIVILTSIVSLAEVRILLSRLLSLKALEFGGG